MVALAFTAVQLITLAITRPYIRRGVHIVESISLLSETALFGVLVFAKGVSSNPLNQKGLGSLMLGLLGATFISQVTNEWYSMTNYILHLSGPEKISFKLGLKSAAKGLILPFLSKRGSAPAPGKDQLSAMNSTVVPMLSPSPVRVIPAATGPALPSQQTREEKSITGLKLEPRSEIRKLRELAKASLSTDPRDEKEEEEHGRNSNNYPFRVQSSDTSSDDPEPSSLTPPVTNKT